MINDGLWCSFEECHMGNAGEVVARDYHIDRECQDRYAVESHRRAATRTPKDVSGQRSFLYRSRKRKGRL
jgi:acetyl-CoA acetyltransferase